MKRLVFFCVCHGAQNNEERQAFSRVADVSITVMGL